MRTAISQNQARPNGDVKDMPCADLLMEKAMAGGVKQWLAAFRLLLSRSFESGSTASRFDAFLHSY